MRSPLAHLVLAYLCGQHEYLRQHEIGGTGLRHSAACWALLLLRRHGLVDAVPDPSGMGGTCGTRRGRSDGGAENNRLREDRAGMARGRQKARRCCAQSMRTRQGRK